MALVALEKLGDGGFADVWRGKDHLDRAVAIKIVRPAALGVSDALAHARALARTNHPNVVTVYHVDKIIAPDTSELSDCVVMELVHGTTLAKLLESASPLDERDALRIGHGIIDGLEHIHNQGLVHGDLHEENVIIARDRVKIIDILYLDSLAMLSGASHEARIRRDLASLRSLLSLLIVEAAPVPGAAQSFATTVRSTRIFAEVRSAFDKALPCGGEQLSPVDADPAVAEGAGPVDACRFFQTDRLSAAFPGVRGLKEFTNPSEIVERLDILLRAPLTFRESVTGRGGVVEIRHTPMWWWRGLTNYQIEHYRRLTTTDILVNRTDELRVHRAFVFNPPAHWKAFVYLEFESMDPIGLYEHSQAALDAVRHERHPVSEEYATFAGTLITRAEYDDGAAVLDGKVVDTCGQAELRCRYITPYNFIITSEQSPVNNSAFDRSLDAIMSGLLRGTHAIDDLCQAIEELPRRGG